MTTDSPLKILYIAGEGRSGSTILGNILGKLDGFFFIGEAVEIWRYFLLENKVCACGVPAQECQVWKKILRNAFDLEALDAHKIDIVKDSIVRNRFIWKMLMPYGENHIREEFADYLNHLENLYWSISKNTGAKIIVDSSKRPLYAYLLNLLPNFKVYTLHLVRDSRGVAYSWGKRKIQTQPSKETIYMPQFTPLKSAWRWNTYNFLTELLLKKSSSKFMTVRYEDFVNEPTKRLYNILQFLDLPQQELPINLQKQVFFTTSHSILGNPCRFQTGIVTLHQDHEWKRRLPLFSKSIVSFLTKYGLRRYDYE